jgi:hypothetical protein
MLNLISYWGVITLIASLLVLCVAPYLIMLANHGCKTISKGELGDYHASSFILKRLGLEKALGKAKWVILHGKSQDIQRFDEGSTVLSVVMSVIVGLLLIIAYIEGRYTSLVSLAHNIALSTHEYISFFFIFAGLYLLVVKVGQFAYAVGVKINKLEGDSDA